MFTQQVGSRLASNSESHIDFMNDEPVDVVLEKLREEIELIDNLSSSFDVEAIYRELFDELRPTTLSWRMVWDLVRWMVVKPSISARDNALLERAIGVRAEFNRRKHTEEVSAEDERNNKLEIKAILKRLDAFQNHGSSMRKQF